MQVGDSDNRKPAHAQSDGAQWGVTLAPSECWPALDYLVPVKPRHSCDLVVSLLVLRSMGGP